MATKDTHVTLYGLLDQINVSFAKNVNLKTA